VSAPSNDLTVPDDGVSATSGPGPAADGGTAGVTGSGTGRRLVWPAPLPLLLVAAGAGIAVGAGWAVLAPVVVRWTGSVEKAAAGDVTFGLLGILAGLITAVVLLVWPGARPAAHAAEVLAAAAAASLLAWGVGRLLGAPTLHALALIVLWPLMAAVVTMIRALIGVLFAAPEG
jgi:hypothetical protein